MNILEFFKNLVGFKKEVKKVESQTKVEEPKIEVKDESINKRILRESPVIVDPVREVIKDMIKEENTNTEVKPKSRETVKDIKNRMVEVSKPNESGEITPPKKKYKRSKPKTITTKK